MTRIGEILEGWKNLIWENPEIEALAKERLEICATCEMRSNYPEDINMASICTRCSCVLEAKSRCGHCVCPMSKWARQ